MGWPESYRDHTQLQEECFLLKDLPLLCFEPKHIQAPLKENPKEFNFDSVIKGYLYVLANNLRVRVWDDYDKDRLETYAKFVRERTFKIARIRSLEYLKKTGYCVLYQGAIPYYEKAADNIYATVFPPGRVMPQMVIKGSKQAKELAQLGY